MTTETYWECHRESTGGGSLNSMQVVEPSQVTTVKEVGAKTIAAPMVSHSYVNYSNEELYIHHMVDFSGIVSPTLEVPDVNEHCGQLVVHSFYTYQPGCKMLWVGDSDLGRDIYGSLNAVCSSSGLFDASGDYLGSKSWSVELTRTVDVSTLSSTGGQLYIKSLNVAVSIYNTLSAATGHPSVYQVEPEYTDISPMYLGTNSTDVDYYYIRHYRVYAVRVLPRNVQYPTIYAGDIEISLESALARGMLYSSRLDAMDSIYDSKDIHPSVLVDSAALVALDIERGKVAELEDTLESIKNAYRKLHNGLTDLSPLDSSELLTMEALLIREKSEKNKLDGHLAHGKLEAAKLAGTNAKLKAAVKTL